MEKEKEVIKEKVRIEILDVNSGSKIVFNIKVKDKTSVCSIEDLPASEESTKGTYRGIAGSFIDLLSLRKVK